MRWALLAALGIAGCSGPYTQLPAPEQERFNRCGNIVAERQCGDDRDTMYQTICRRNLADDYAREPNEERRARWLVRHGCPADMVDYQAQPESGGQAAAREPPIAGYARNAGIPTDGRVTHENDEFTRTTLYRAQLVAEPFLLTLTRSPDEPTALVTLVSINQPASFATCHRVDLLADGQPTNYPETNYSASASASGSIETVAVTVPSAVVAALANAQTARGRVCATQFALTPAQRATLREFVAGSTTGQ